MASIPTSTYPAVEPPPAPALERRDGDFIVGVPGQLRGGAAPRRGARGGGLLARSLPRARFVLAGDGTEYGRIRQRAEELALPNLEFLATLPRAADARLLQRVRCVPGPARAAAGVRARAADQALRDHGLRPSRARFSGWTGRRSACRNRRRDCLGAGQRRGPRPIGGVAGGDVERRAGPDGLGRHRLRLDPFSSGTARRLPISSCSVRRQPRDVDDRDHRCGRLRGARPCA